MTENIRAARDFVEEWDISFNDCAVPLRKLIPEDILLTILQALSLAENSVEALLEKVPPYHSAEFFIVEGRWYCGIKRTDEDDDAPYHVACLADTPAAAIKAALECVGKA